MVNNKYLNYFLFLLALISIGSGTYCQNSPTANHIALYVKDLKKSAGFYKNIMQLEEISEPFHDGKHVWFRTGAHSQLHIIQGASDVTEHDINTHYAYSVINIQDFIRHLDEMHIRYGNWKGDSKLPQLRPDGIKQVYLQDPDNFWIEINDDKF